MFKAIGNFFRRIGRWIRDTAWIQPLLIVAAIFIVVFSIPYITVWVRSWYNGDASVSYYQKYALSLDECEDGKSEVDNLFQYLDDQSENKATSEQKDKYGEKFFLSFVQEGCSDCESNYYGFNYLQTNWNKSGYEIVDNGTFKIYTIFIDEYDDDDKYNLFSKYVYNSWDTIFEISAGTYQESYYYMTHTESMESALESMLDADSFSTPTTFLIDFTKDAPFYTNEYGISEIFFDYEGTTVGGGDTTTPQAKATTLRDCWNHDGDFGKDNYDKS